jgi:hypothetical protein
MRNSFKMVPKQSKHNLLIIKSLPRIFLNKIFPKGNTHISLILISRLSEQFMKNCTLMNDSEEINQNKIKTETPQYS